MKTPEECSGHDNCQYCVIIPHPLRVLQAVLRVASTSMCLQATKNGSTNLFYLEDFQVELFIGGQLSLAACGIHAGEEPSLRCQLFTISPMELLGEPKTIPPDVFFQQWASMPSGLCMRAA